MRDTLKWLLDKYSATVVRHPLPGARGLTTKKGHGYRMVINDSLSPEAEARTVAHELLHIMLGHLDDRSHLSEQEKEQEVIGIIREHFGGKYEKNQKNSRRLVAGVDPGVLRRARYDDRTPGSAE